MTRTNEVGETCTASATDATTPAGDAQPVYPHTMRLQRFLARAGVASRRGSEDLMTAGRVTVNGKVARASYDVKVGDVIAVRKMQVTYSYRVLDLVSSRQPAKNVPLYCLNITPQEELDKLSIPRETIFVFRDRGTGRPTKKERRELDGLMDGIYYDGDE